MMARFGKDASLPIAVALDEMQRRAGFYDAGSAGHGLSIVRLMSENSPTKN
jgi:hypothetical protein